MPTQVLGSVLPVEIQVKEAWADSWTAAPALEFVRASHHATAADLDALEVRHRYGMLKHPWESSISYHAAYGDLAGWWIRAVLESDPPRVLFTGRVECHARTLHHSQAHGPSGVQSFVAYGPLQILRRIHLSSSHWLVSSAKKQLGWMPVLNDFETHGYRSESVFAADGVYLFDGTTTTEWNHLQFLQYLLKQFADEGGTDGPAWSIAGQTDPLEDRTERLELGEFTTLDQAIRELISPKRGLDYKIVATANGFELVVFSLQDQEYTWEGGSLPANPDTVSFAAGQSLEQITTQVVRSHEHSYKKIRLLGERIVVHATLWGLGAQQADGDHHPNAGTLVSAWSQSDEIAHRVALGSTWYPTEAHDEFRQKFPRVWTTYKIAADWDWQDGQAAPLIEDTGELSTTEYADRQRALFELLPSTRLDEGTDYAQSPPDDSAATGDFLPALVWIGNFDRADPWNEDSPHTYTRVEELGWHIAVSPQAGEILVQANPPHLLAAYEWAQAGEWAPTSADPGWNCRELVATVAMRSDQRLVLEYELPGWTKAAGTLEVHVPGAECWCIAPRTALAVDSDGHLVETTELVTLRNDRQQLVQVMTELVARYAAARCRAVISANGYQDWGDLVGQILTAITDGGPTERMAAPITSVEWEANDGGLPVTTLRAGFAS
ncbi:MAG: hypothetical protein ACOY3P_17890 [Planctomycetota bacterium]